MTSRRVLTGIRQSHPMPVYQDLLIAFHGQPPDMRATVWRRQFPRGRQRRKQVAEYSLPGLPVDATPEDLLQALIVRMRTGPDYTV